MSLLPIAYLECGHSVQFGSLSATPGRGENIYCMRCRKYFHVKFAPAKLSIRCETCRFSRATYGHVRLTAERDVSRHMKKQPTHTVAMYDGLIKEWTFKPDLTPIPNLLDKNPSDPPY